MTSTHTPYGGVVFDTSEANSIADILDICGDFKSVISGGPIAAIPMDVRDMIQNTPDGETVTLNKHDIVWQDRYKSALVDDSPSGTVVGGDRGFTQPMQSLEIAQFCVDNLGAKHASVATMYNGMRTLSEVSMPQQAFTIDRGGRLDSFDPRACIIDSNDSTHSWDWLLLMDQLFCRNQYPAIDAQGRRQRNRHSSRVANRQSMAQQFFTNLVQVALDEQRALQTLENTKIDKTSFVEFAAKLLSGLDNTAEALKAVGESEGRGRAILERKMETLDTLFRIGTGNRGKTALDAFSAVTEWQTWGGRSEEDAEIVSRAQARHVSGQLSLDSIADRTIEMREATEIVLSGPERARTEQRLQSNLNGNSAKMAQRAQRLLMEMAEAQDVSNIPTSA